MTAVASDRELIDLLAERGGGRGVLELSRKPYRYATSAPLEELHVRMEDGEEMALIFKDLSRDRLLGDAPAAKPEFVHQPRREVETYRRILAPAKIGPRCLAAIAESNPERHWLLIEKVPGVELWQVGELDVWEEVARWLARFHARFAGRLDEIRAANPYLLEHSDAWFRSWRARAQAALARSSDPRAPRLEPALERYEEVVEALAALPPTFVHGELYASNVLVVGDEQPVRVCPVDWEMAAIGPGLVDLAALIGGWSPARQRRLVAAYLGAIPDPRPVGLSPEALPAELARCRLHLALQMLGWAPDWRPPPEHAHDWLGEALSLAGELELS